MLAVRPLARVRRRDPGQVRAPEGAHDGPEGRPPVHDHEAVLKNRNGRPEERARLPGGPDRRRDGVPDVAAAHERQRAEGHAQEAGRQHHARHDLRGDRLHVDARELALERHLEQMRAGRHDAGADADELRGAPRVPAEVFGVRRRHLLGRAVTKRAARADRQHRPCPSGRRVHRSQRSASAAARPRDLEAVRWRATAALQTMQSRLECCAAFNRRNTSRPLECSKV
mmetsp:Transcript_18896/g.56141  ORF Transcript_18896/g.56141 Transcript_18896/m.56141 type:complete len:227 (+) Transcript_18896:21-701(+)